MSLLYELYWCDNNEKPTGCPEQTRSKAEKQFSGKCRIFKVAIGRKRTYCKHKCTCILFSKNAENYLDTEYHVLTILTKNISE